MRFDKYRNILKNFKTEVDSVINRRNDEISRAEREYNKNVLSEKVGNIRAEHSNLITAIRQKYLEQLDEATANMRSRNSGKYCENYIDFQLLEKLNIIANSGVPLTASELESLTRKAMSSRSSLCVRKCQLMAKSSGLELSVPSEEAANAVLDETDRRIREIIQEYSGKPTGRVDGHYMAIAVWVEGTFLDALEKRYEAATVEDITISTISVEEYTAQKKEKQQKKGVEVVETGHLGISTKPTDGSSVAAQYARKYSHRMASGR